MLYSHFILLLVFLFGLRFFGVMIYHRLWGYLDATKVPWEEVVIAVTFMGLFIIFASVEDQSLHPPKSWFDVYRVPYGVFIVEIVGTSLLSLIVGFGLARFLPEIVKNWVC